VRILEGRFQPIVSKVVVGCDGVDFLQIVVIVHLVDELFRNLEVQPHTPWTAQIIALVHYYGS
jgi:hypothetical protein